MLVATGGTLDDWRDRLRPALPAACLPRQLVVVDAIPRGPGGKPDRAALDAMLARRDAVEAGGLQVRADAPLQVVPHGLGLDPDRKSVV